MPTKTKRGNDQYLSPLNIPEQKIGNWSIEHRKLPANQPIMLNNYRNAILGGQQAKREVSWPYETTWRYLKENGGTWMSDMPVEYRQAQECLKGLKGTVLVGGLGLGLAATILARKKSVKHIVVIEQSPEVVKMVGLYTLTAWNPKGRYRGWKTEIVTADLFDYLKNYDGPMFDYAFYDIWQSDGEGTFFDTVCPLYDASYNKVKNLPINWNEDVMRGQLLSSINNRLLYLKHPDFLPKVLADRMYPPWEHDGTEEPWHNWMVPYFQWWKQTNPTEEQEQQAAAFYSGQYGKWQWKAFWEAFISL